MSKSPNTNAAPRIKVDVSYQATLIQHLTKLTEDFLSIFKGNTDRELGRFFFWKNVEDYAKKQKEVSMKSLTEADIIADDYRALPEGEHTIGESPAFFVTDKVSKGRRTFDPEVLAETLAKKYKVPKPITKELVEQSKVEGSAMHTIKIVER